MEIGALEGGLIISRVKTVLGGRLIQMWEQGGYPREFFEQIIRVIMPIAIDAYPPLSSPLTT